MRPTRRHPANSLAHILSAPGGNDASARPALLVFAVAELVGAILYLVNGSKVWFFGVFGDEWDFLAGRRLSLHDLLLPHGDHLVALPALVFRLLYGVFGLHSYLPYQLLSIGLHLVAAALLRLIMRRAGVRPWIATAAATLFVLFGAGSQDILIAFQITFSGALVLGLVQLLLADHDGPIGRRDALGLLAGFGALLCSDVAIVMIAVVGIACLLRRSWRAAALHTLPLAVVYAAWTRAYGRSARTDFDVSEIARSVHTSLTRSFGALGQVPFVGWVLAIMLVAGLAIAWRDSRRSELRSRLSAVFALALGAPIFALILGVTRFGLGAHFAASSRYLHIIAALVLPALAVAADALARRWRALGIAAIVVFLVGVPGNVADIGRNVGPAARYREQRRVIGALSHMKLAGRVPGALNPTPTFAAQVTVSWLLDGARSGQIPRSGRPTPRQRATDTLRLSLDQLDGTRASQCVPLTAPVTRRLALGDSFGLRGAIAVQSIPIGRGARSEPLVFGTSLLATAKTHTVRDVTGPLELRIAPVIAAALCR
jgi:hypothetical protein